MTLSTSISSEKLYLMNEIIRTVVGVLPAEKTQKISQLSIDWKSIDSFETLLPTLDIKFD